jgi:hypothetical protein
MVLMLSVQERQLLLELQTLQERQQWLPYSPLQLAWRSQTCQLRQLFWK